MPLGTLYKTICIYLKQQKQSTMPYRNFMIALGKLQNRGIILNNDGYIGINAHYVACIPDAYRL